MRHSNDGFGTIETLMVSGSHFASFLPSASILFMRFAFVLTTLLHISAFSSLSEDSALSSLSLNIADFFFMQLFMGYTLLFMRYMLLFMGTLSQLISLSLASSPSMGSDLLAIKSGSAFFIISYLPELLSIGAEHLYILGSTFADLRTGAADAFGAALAIDPPKPPIIPERLGMLGIWKPLLFTAAF